MNRVNVRQSTRTEELASKGEENDLGPCRFWVDDDKFTLVSTLSGAPCCTLTSSIDMGIKGLWPVSTTFSSIMAADQGLTTPALVMRFG